MSARCLRCGAGNEWIEGRATHKKDPPISREDLERVCSAADAWSGRLELADAIDLKKAIARVREACK